jgi:O-acetylserine/cysteine efflux transporter
MKAKDLCLIVLLTAIWGLNFSIIKIALQDFPPLMLAALRFTLVAIPAIFFLPKPTVSWWLVATYAMLMFILQFSFLFAGISLGVPAGVASLMLQAQVFATILFALWFNNERPSRHGLIGALIGASGLAMLIVANRLNIALLGLLFVLIAATCWGAANVMSRKKLQHQAVLSLVCWGAMFSVLPIALASFFFEGWLSWQQAITSAQITSWLALAYIVYPTTLAGFAIWAVMLTRYPAASVAPFTMLVPIFGIFFASLMLNEAVNFIKIASGIVVIAGVAFTQFGHRILKSRI